MFEKLQRRELDFGEFFMISIKLFFKNLHWIGVFTIIFSTALQYISAVAVGEMARINPYRWAEGGAGTWAMLLPVFFVNLIFYQFVNMTVTFIVWKSVQNEKVTWSGIFKLVANKIFSSLKIGVLVAGFFFLWGIGPLVLALFNLENAATIAILLLIFPVIYWVYNYLFAQHSLIIEDQRGIAALHYSRELVRDRWWELFGKMLAAGFIWGLLNLMTITPLQYLIQGNLIGNLIIFGLQSTSRSFTWVLTTVLFLNFNYIDKRSSIIAPEDQTTTI